MEAQRRLIRPNAETPVLSNFGDIAMLRAIALSILCICAFCSEALAAKDSLSIGSVDGRAGDVVRVPIRLFDSISTPLGIDRGFGSQIHSFGLQVVYDNASAVQALSIERSGELAGKNAMIETTRAAGNTSSLVVSFNETNTSLDFSAQGGTEIASVVVLLKAGIAKGTKVTLSFRPTTTTLSNQSGMKTETSENGSLELKSGAITITKSGGPVGSVVSISAAKISVMENGKRVRLRVQRAGLTKNAILVHLRYSGKAKNGIDYRKLPKSVLIKAKKKRADLYLAPIKDAKKEDNEAAVITVAKGKGYLPFAPTSATIVIKDAAKK
jgi:hypothetical protein